MRIQLKNGLSCFAIVLWLTVTGSAGDGSSVKLQSIADWSEGCSALSAQSYWRDEKVLQRYTFSENKNDKIAGESSMQVHMRVSAKHPKDVVELRLTLPQPIDLSRVEAVELWLKVVAGSGLKVRDAFFCSPGFRKLVIADWLEEVDVSAPAPWQRMVLDLADVRIIDKDTSGQTAVYDGHDVTTICLNFILPPGEVDIILQIDGIRAATLPLLPGELLAPALRRDTRFWVRRSKYPAVDLSPRSDDGHNLALSIRKLTGGVTPERPFLIWGIGPSYLNFLGDGRTLACHLRRRFPHAPPIIYKKYVGSSVPWRYVLGWANHMVIPEQPDLVLLYGIGLEKDLENIFRTLRQHTTADIIVASVHWKLDDIKYWGKDEDATDFADIPQMRRICEEYGVEFVENRKEWAQYLRDHNMKVEVDPEHGLLMDAVHQSKYGALVINESIARHFAVRDNYAYDPESRERHLNITEGNALCGRESAVILGSNWTLRDGMASTTASDHRLKVRFTGNRIDLIGVKSPDGGSVRMMLDGVPAEKVSCFFVGPIVSATGNTPPKTGSIRDIGPHGIVLCGTLVPQVWTIRLTDDEGNYELTGSVTGVDGRGHILKPFVSNSGQINIPPELWRHGAGCVPFLHPWNGQILNKTDDTYTFKVYCACKNAVDFHGESGEFCISLFQNLPNQSHILELITVGSGKVTVKRLDIFEPPLRFIEKADVL